MPTSAPHACSHPGCPLLVPSGQSRCLAHQRKKEAQRREDSPNPYNNNRWREVRKGQLSAAPLCAQCALSGRTKAASVCDHIDPHKGDMKKFWAGPFQSLCAECHNRKTATTDGGFGRAIIK